MRRESVGKKRLKVVPQKRTQRDKLDICSVMTEVFLAEEYCESPPTATEMVPPAPDLDFTFEEEFRIYELLVRKENLLDGMFEISLQFPKFLEIWKDFLLSHGKLMTQEYRKNWDQINETVSYNYNYNFSTGGSIWHSLDMFDEFKKVNQYVKIETLGFSLIVFRVFKR